VDRKEAVKVLKNFIKHVKSDESWVKLAFDYKEELL
jgi:hypothetical protein